MAKSRRPTPDQLDQAEVVLRGLGYDLADLATELHAGSAVVRVFVNPSGKVILTARMHANMGGDFLNAPTEWITLREEVGIPEPPDYNTTNPWVKQ